MKTAYLFPGLNGLLRQKDRERYLELPHVKKRLQQAQAVLRRELGLETDLMKMLTQNTDEIYQIHNISLAAVVISSIQVGVVDHLRERFQSPDWMVGVSLGDIARTVSAGAYDFETAVVAHVKFTHKIDGIDKLGGNIGVATTLARPFTQEDFDWFEQEGVDVSVLTSRFLNVGALFSALASVRARAKERGWRIMPILDYPAHSRYIRPYVDASEKEFLEVQTMTPKIPIFSTLSCKALTLPDEIKREFLETITRTIHFEAAITTLHKEHGVTRFINIGPCKSLYTLLRDIPLDFQIEDAEDLLNSTK
ncbi:MAG: acyltransferase domain-containing protein [Bacteriovorax sp.]|nr:acyltransferase domain-containing protein [Bacteriovorax sp.]